MLAWEASSELKERGIFHQVVALAARTLAFKSDGVKPVAQEVIAGNRFAGWKSNDYPHTTAKVQETEGESYVKGSSAKNMWLVVFNVGFNTKTGQPELKYRVAKIVKGTAPQTQLQAQQTYINTEEEAESLLGQ